MDEEAAVKWIHLAAEQGNAAGQSNLGVTYLEGRGVDKNADEALKWLTISARQGLALARDYLWTNGNITVESRH